MIKYYLRSSHNDLFSLKPSKAILAFLIFNFFLISTVFGQSGPNCPSGICIGPGGAITSGSSTVTCNSFYSSIIVKNGETLTVKSGVTMYVGAVGTAANTQVVDFQNGCIVVIESGASLIVNGLLNNSNNSNGVTFNGTVTVTGNVTAGNGSTIVGAGTLDTTGTISTQDPNGSIFGSTGDCITGPCSGSQLNCSGVTNTISSNQTICSGNTPAPLTGSTTVNPATYQWQMSATSGANFVNISNAIAANYSPGQLNTTTYYRRMQTTGGCTGTSAQIVISVNTITWTGATSTSWFTPSNWSCGSVPTVATDVLISNGAIKPIIDGISTTALANTITVSASASLTVNSGNTIKVTDKVTNNGGTITIEDAASLVQTNNVTNSGNIVYKRNISSALTSDYTYWSSPVASQNLNLSSYYASGLFYSYNDFATPEDWQKETAATIMQIGKGYIIRGPLTTVPPGIYNATFTGVPNNGPKSIAVSGGGKSTLIGNPYPSAIDADTFLSANSAAIDGTLYFWTHNTAIQSASNITNGSGTGALAYTSNDYAVYNLTGGVIIDGVKYLIGGTIAPNGGVLPTGKIAAGQSFFTTSTIAGGTVNFTNAMRVDGSGNALNNSNFFKTKNPNTKTGSTTEKDRVWLNLSNTQGAFKQALIGYITDATNEFDSRFDGESFDGNEFVDFYSINQDKNLVIQGRALPFDENDEVPLGFRTTIKGDFTINIDQVDGLLTDQNVFIEDKLMNKTANLKEGNYTFNTTVGTFDDRFVLRYTDKTLSVEQTDKEDGILVLYSNNYKTLIIHNNDMYSVVNTVAIVNMTGQNISNWEVNDSEQTNIQFPLKNISSGVYIVKVKTTKGESSKKIIVR